MNPPVKSRLGRGAPEDVIRPVQMARYALLLRGVNVGTKNALPMAELRAMLDAIGCRGVRTLLQSGNAVLETSLGEGALRRALEARLADRMRRRVDTTLRTLPELVAVRDGNPFDRKATDPARLCVTFLSRAPTSAESAPLRSRSFEPERVRIAGREIYSWHPDGQGKSPLAAAIAKLPFDGTVTTRNWNTLMKLIAMLEAGPG